MCGIAGWINTNENIKDNVQIIKAMTDTLRFRGPDDEGYAMYRHAALGHRRLTIVDPEGGAQPMTREKHGNQYTIVYNGELYNTEEVRRKLLNRGYSFQSYSDTEVLLTAYIEWGAECLSHINGIFAFGIWDESKKEIFLARDPLGVKPLFYAHKSGSLLFGSEIKVLLAYPSIEPVVDRDGLLEIIGLGPARSLGGGVFKDIQEVPPAHCLHFDGERLRLTEYWKLEAKSHEENFTQTVEHVRNLLVDAIERQLVSDVPVCTFLSGGLDSSVISTITANAFKREGKDQLNTFSIDYEDNNIYFKANEYQPNADSYWVDKMSRYVESRHHNVILSNADLATALDDAVLANDLPGMADIDSSLLLFCKEVRKEATVALSGECADEVFGGYPWYRRPEDFNCETFPWAKSTELRKRILSKSLKKLPVDEYIMQQYQDTKKAVPRLKGEIEEDEKMREMFYLNIKWFMITLLNRKDRMSMRNSLEVRVPFADYRIVEYAFNIPSSMKFYGNREKGLLREALKDILPDDVLYRKKSPYPKTHHPIYTKAVQEKMLGILKDKRAPIYQIIDENEVMNIVQSGGSSIKSPWFGQLMTGPQVIAHLIQINTWMEKYKIKLDL
ncbi:MAG: asparagine synthase (glutamine-hydrolyzing) [Bacillota bacterium]